MKSRTIDFNLILTFLNVLVTILAVVTFFHVSEAPYINSETIILSGILSIQTHVALAIERRRRDPFVILLAFVLILFFSLRVATLAAYSYSLVFLRFPFTAADLNYALIFIIIANLFLYAGFYKVSLGKNRKVESSNWSATSTRKAITLLLVTIILDYPLAYLVNPTNIPRIIIFLQVFLVISTVVPMAFSYLYLFKKSMNRIQIVAFISLITLELVLHTVTGSRSAILGLMQTIILVILAATGCLTIKKKYLYLGLMFSPLFISMGILSYTFATATRANAGNANRSDLSFMFEVIKKPEVWDALNSNSEAMLRPLFDRIGYLDYSAEIIAHTDEYGKLFTVSNYAKSIIDNLLTPGFDVFDQPKMSNAMVAVYDGDWPPSKLRVSEVYRSDQFGLYGELFALFGYVSLPLFYLFAFFMKKTYVILQGKDPFELTIKRVIVLTAFYSALNSFGFDWIAIEIFAFSVTIYIWKSFFTSSLEPDYLPIK